MISESKTETRDFSSWP